VSRTPSPEDGRRMEVELTATGKTLSKKAPRATQESILMAISSLSSQEQKTLDKLLVKLVEASSIDLEPASLFFEEDSK